MSDIQKLNEAFLELERIKKNRWVTDEMLAKIKSILFRIGQYGPQQGEKHEGIACMFCDMGQAGYAFRGDGFHDDACAVKDAQLLYLEMFGATDEKP